MPTHYRSFLVVALLGFLGLLICRRVFAPLMLSEDDYRRRRNLWLVITFAAFLLPSFWAYAAVAAIAIAYTARRDSNPAALFALLLIVVPPLEAIVPVLFNIHHQRVLILALLVPIAWRLLGDSQLPGPFRLLSDKLLLLYCLLQVVLLWPYTSMTNSVRQVVLILMDTWLPYYVMSRAFSSRAQLRDAMACFVLTLVIVAPMALAEVQLGTMLYGEIASSWNIHGLFGYLMRGESLRAQLASGQAIVLGYQFAVAIGMWLYLQRHIPSPLWRAVGALALFIGVMSPLSRGPWIGAAAILAGFALLAPGAMRRTMTWGAIGLLLFAVMLMTPWGDKMIGYLPFVGNAAQESVDYRQEILAVCWQLILQNPFFGSPYASAQLESLRTGEGIIDIVNTYIALGMSYGLVGVGLFLGIFLSVMGPLVKAARSPEVLEDDRYLATSLLVTLVGVLVTISTVSNYLTIPFIYMMLLGLAVTFVRVTDFRSTS